MTTLHEVVVEAKGRAEGNVAADGDYTVGWSDGVMWLLGLLAECDDVEDEALEDFV